MGIFYQKGELEMLKTLKERLKNQRGLTLVELLAVVVILGIISAIAVPSITGIIQKAKVDAVKAETIHVLNAAKLYHAQNSKDNDISSEDLESYLDNVKLTSYSVNFNSGSFTVTAEGKAGEDVTVYIYGATLDDLNDDTKWVKNDKGDEITVGNKPTPTPKTDSAT
jgi:type IV pilus assembly protein PilA